MATAGNSDPHTLFNRQMPEPRHAPPGRDQAMPLSGPHAVFGRPLDEPVAPGHDVVLLAMGCFWGAEKLLWSQAGIVMTSVGYAGGVTINPDYSQVCSGRTGHSEVVRVTFDPAMLAHDRLIGLFFEGHDPTQGMRQGNDIGSQYRSAIYWQSPKMHEAARRGFDTYQENISRSGHPGKITTEIGPMPAYYFAEEEHQQYLAKNPHGYCAMQGTGITMATG